MRRLIAPVVAVLLSAPTADASEWITRRDARWAVGQTFPDWRIRTCATVTEPQRILKMVRRRRALCSVAKSYGFIATGTAIVTLRGRFLLVYNDALPHQGTRRVRR